MIEVLLPVFAASFGVTFWLVSGIRRYRSYTTQQLREDMKLLRQAEEVASYGTLDYDRVRDISGNTRYRSIAIFIPKYGLIPKEREYLRAVLEDAETEEILRQEGIQ